MKAGREEIHLDIRNRTGSVEHYFHFLTGFLVPLVLEHDDLHEDSGERRFYTRSCSIMDRHIRDLGLENLQLVDKEVFAARDAHVAPSETSLPQRTVVRNGYDRPEHYDRSTFHRARSILSHRLRHPVAACRSMFEGKVTANAPNIVAIDRSAPHPFYDSDRCEIRGAGTSRRSIPNFHALSAAIRSRYSNTLVVTLEDKSLAYQIALFGHADIVIAQHGAALANMLWCKPGATVIEIYPCDMHDRGNGIDFFGALSRCMGLRHVRIGQAHSHAEVDVRLVLDQLEDTARKRGKETGSGSLPVV